MATSNPIEIKKESISEIPSIYYTATSNLISKIDSHASKLMGKTTLPGGTVIALTINLAKDPDNPNKVIISTILISGVIYVVGTQVNLLAIEAIVGAIAMAAGITMTPLAITLVAIGGIAIMMTTLGDRLYGELYKLLQWIEDEYNDIKETDIFTLHGQGKLTDKELSLVLDKMEENESLSCLEGYKELKSLRPIINIENQSLSSYIKVNFPDNKVNIQEKTLEEVKPILKEVLDDDKKYNDNKLKKHDVKIKTTVDDEEYTIMKKELVEHLAKKEGVSISDVYNYSENNWIKDKKKTAMSKTILLNTIFSSISALYRKNLSSLSLLSSFNIFSKSLDVEKNLAFTNMVS